MVVRFKIERASCRGWCVQQVDAERWNAIAKETVASLQGRVIKRQIAWTEPWCLQ